MPKKDDEKDDKPVDWTPDQPLPDADDEAETNRVAQASARRKFLEDSHLKKLEKSGKPDKKQKKSLWG